jgi:malonyl CoA-acyl carrier protein transacylase
MAGLSLGEYSALVAAGAMTFKDGLKVSRAQGELQGEVLQKAFRAVILGDSRFSAGAVPQRAGSYCCSPSSTATSCVNAASIRS